MARRGPTNHSEREDRAQTELVAAEMVIDHLRSRGDRVDLLERPDQLNRTDRAADFLLEIDGQSFALEVTDFYPTEADGARRGIGRWLAERLEAELRPQVSERGMGSVVVSVTLPRRPDRKRLSLAISDIAQVILARLPAEGSVVVDDDWDQDDLFGRMRLFRWADRPSRVEVLHQPHGSFVEPAVAAFLDRMLPSKAAQTAGYEQVILAAFDRSFVGDPESFQRQLDERAQEIPANWRAIYFITPVRGGGSWQAWPVWERELSGERL